jgi:hypothetical protein
MLENYELLNKVVPPEGVRQPYPQLAAQILQSLSTSVYGEYLGRLDSLKPEEVDKIYEAYSSIEAGIKGANEFRDALRRGLGRDEVAARAVLVVSMAEKAHSDLANALRLFPQGENKTKELETERGHALQTYDSISEMLSEQASQAQSTQIHDEGTSSGPSLRCFDT